MILAAAAASSHTQTVLIDIAATLGVALACGVLLQRLGQSVLPGYLIAGLLVGPGALGIVGNPEELSAIAELGVALLLFAIGLELPWAKVQRMGSRALVAGFVQVGATLILVTPALAAAGVDPATALAIAMAVSLSSTAIVMRLLTDRSETDSVHGLAATGLLLTQDLAVVVFLLVVPALGDEGGSWSAFIGPFLGSLGKLAGLVLAMWVLELLVMRRLFGSGTLARQREMLTVASIAVSLGAVGACFALGLSPALGGFIAGVLMADAAYADQVRGQVAPLRMGLAAIFFAWVGMLADLGYMIDHVHVVVGVAAAVFVGKALLSFGSLRVVGVPAAAAPIAAVAVAQLGEFSFAILSSSSKSGLLDADAFHLLISASLVTLLVVPTATALTSRMVHARAGARRVTVSEHEPATRRVGHVLVVGAGPSGITVIEAVAAAGHLVTVVELNPNTASAIATSDIPDDLVDVVFGDAARPEVLLRAGLMTARMLVLAIPDQPTMHTIMSHARELAPGITVIARGRYHVYVDDLRSGGADIVVDEECVVGRDLAQSVLARMDSEQA